MQGPGVACVNILQIRKAKSVKISQKKIQLSTHLTFEGINIETSADYSLVFSLHKSKLDDVRSFKSPSNKRELQSFFGVAATFNCWNPNISKFSEKMCKLNSKGLYFKNSEQWSSELEEEFQSLKTETCQVFEKKAL